MTIVNINFDKAGSSAITGWNSLYGGTASNVALNDDQGGASGLTLTKTGGTTSDFNNAGYADTAVDGIPVAVWDSFWFFSDAVADPVFTISGFSANEAVTLKIAGFKGNQAWSTSFDVNGSSQTYVCTGGAIPQTPPTPLTFNTTANGSGQIVVTATELSSYGYITFITLEYGAPSNTTINVDIPLHINAEWGTTHELAVTHDGGTTTLSNVTLSAPTGWEVVTLASLDPSAGPNPEDHATLEYYARTDALLGGGGYTMQVGDQFAWSVTSRTNPTSVLTISDTTNPVLTKSNGDPVGNITADYKIWRVGASSWTAVSSFTVNNLGVYSGGGGGDDYRFSKRVIRKPVRLKAIEPVKTSIIRKIH